MVQEHSMLKMNTINFFLNIIRLLIINFFDYKEAGVIQMVISGSYSILYSGEFTDLCNSKIN